MDFSWNIWGWEVHGWKVWGWIAFDFVVEKSRVGKFMVEKSGVENPKVEAWGWGVEKSGVEMSFNLLAYSVAESIFVISSRKYTITLYTPGHLEVIWELFAKKSEDILSFYNSFILLSLGTYFFLSD